jgi:hypothetical protein
MKVIYLLILSVVSFSAKAQNAKNINSKDSILHIEMYGETGKGDTAIIVYKNGDKRKVLLPDEKSRDKFQKQYKQNLPNHEVNSVNDKRSHEGEQPNHNIIVPKEIAEYTYNDDNIQLKLWNGKTEVYDLNDPAQKKTFIVKYHNFLHLDQK